MLGMIPASLGQLQSLQELNLAGNKLSGKQAMLTRMGRLCPRAAVIVFERQTCRIP